MKKTSCCYIFKRLCIEDEENKLGYSDIDDAILGPIADVKCNDEIYYQLEKVEAAVNQIEGYLKASEDSAKPEAFLRSGTSKRSQTSCAIDHPLVQL